MVSAEMYTVQKPDTDMVSTEMYTVQPPDTDMTPTEMYRRAFLDIQKRTTNFKVENKLGYTLSRFCYARLKPQSTWSFSKRQVIGS